MLPAFGFVVPPLLAMSTKPEAAAGSRFWRRRGRLGWGARLAGRYREFWRSLATKKYRPTGTVAISMHDASRSACWMSRLRLDWATRHTMSPERDDAQAEGDRRPPRPWTSHYNVIILDT